MAFGACKTCGCALEECECPRGGVVPPGAGPAKVVPRFTAHGTYIETYPCFRMVEKLTRAQAFDRLSKSSWILGKVNVDMDRAEEFLGNRSWAVVEASRELGFVDVVYNYNGRYSLRQAPLASFLDVLRQVLDTYSPLRRLYYTLTEPYEHAS